MTGHPWTDAENDLVVTDYFAMLDADLAGRPYNKAEHNRALQRQIGRGRGSIEYKHQNVSAVLKSLGHVWNPGYKPAFNYQHSLIDAVARRLYRAGEPELRRPGRKHAARPDHGSRLVLEPPPDPANRPPPEEWEPMAALARKFDVAGRDQRNRILGRAGEERVLAHERQLLRAGGRSDLAKEVTWVSDEEGDGEGYDIRSFSPGGQPRLIEVKTTNGWERTPFYLTRNERAVAEDRPAEWHLVRVWNFAREPRAFELRPPLEAAVELTPVVYQGSLR